MADRSRTSRRTLAGVSVLLGALAASAVATTSRANVECDRLHAEVAGVVLQAAYYPYPSKLRVYLDVSSVRVPSGLGRPEIVVRNESRQTLFAEALTSPKGEAIVDRVLEIPRLSPGDYTAGVRFSNEAPCGIVPGPERSFRHRDFGWERNTIGRSDAVMPPLTPLEAAPGQVEAVGRRYRFADSGLWRQVESLSEPLLAEAIRLELEVDGRDRQWNVATPAKIQARGDTRVEVGSVLRAGGLELRLHKTYEVDGFARVVLELDGPVDTRLDRLDLVIPMRHGQARFANAITDGARHHLLGPTPSGSGVVWNSLQVGRHRLPPGFVPYVWLGTEERGLAWAAESTRDWLVAPDAPAQEIRRTSGSTDLVVHFVTAPGALGRARRIEFALQATPAKPRPPDWRSWLLTCERFPDALRICALASGRYWGSRTPFANVYPRNKDASILDALAETRRTGRIPDSAISEWLERQGISDPKLAASYRNSLGYAFRSLVSQPDYVVPYINPHGAAATQEFLTYVDEWRYVPFGDRQGRDADPQGEIRIQSTASFHDYLLWYMEKMLDSGAFDGFYFDNTYLRASFDDVVGPAYRDEAGNLVPGVDIFALRDFFRRAQTLVYERSGRWLNLLHMTTTPIAPVQAWSGISLDGEWKYGADDYQDRFPPDFLRAASLGSQSGTMPSYLRGLSAGVRGEERVRLDRQLAGLMAVHEIRVFTGMTGPHEAVWSALFRAGYARDECAVRRYWDENPGFEIRGVEAVGLLVACDGEALAVVSSVGPAGSAQLRIDGEALGLGGIRSCADAERSARLEFDPRKGCAFPLNHYGTRLIQFPGDAQ